MTTKLIFLTEINFKDSPVVRVGLPNKEIVEQYAQNYTEKQGMPPIVVFYDEDTKQFYLAQGHHGKSASGFVDGGLEVCVARQFPARIAANAGRQAALH